MLQHYPPPIPPITVQRQHQHRLTLQQRMAACTAQRLRQITGSRRPVQVIAHSGVGRHKNIDWKITGLLSLGSVPAAALTLWFLSTLHTDTSALNAIIKQGLAVVLILTALAILFKSRLQAFASRHAGDHYHLSDRSLNILTVLTGVVLGIMVTLTSIGAGALGTVALFLLYPFLVTRRLVGTEIAHAVPLTLVAGLGHAGMGNMDWSLLGYLLLGSLPGIYLGSHLTGRISDRVLRPCLATMLLLIGYKLAF